MRRKMKAEIVRRPLMTDTPSIRIVGLNGSPHCDGNTVTLMRWVLEGCTEAGADVEWIHVVDHNIQYCQGCFTCLRTGVCPIEDDLLAVRERLLSADGIVVGSPVYADQPTAQLKTLMDRLTLLNLYAYTFEQQRSVGVATSGVAPTGGVAKNLAGFFGRRSGAIGAKTASLARGYQPLADVHKPGLPAQARALGRRLVADIWTPRRLRFPPLDYVWFLVLQRFVVRRLVTRQPDQFAGVLRIWQEKGWL
jgi:NAD(P)H-dependent FMN reductase